MTFKTLFNKSGDSLDPLEQKYESDIDALDSARVGGSNPSQPTYVGKSAAYVGVLGLGQSLATLNHSRRNKVTNNRQRDSHEIRRQHGHSLGTNPQVLLVLSIGDY